MAVHMAAADVFGDDSFCCLFPKGVLCWDLGLNCHFLIFQLTFKTLILIWQVKALQTVQDALLHLFSQSLSLFLTRKKE